MTYQGLHNAEAYERAKEAEENAARDALIAAARSELTWEPVSLEEFLFRVSRHTRVDLLDAKRALSYLRSYNEADYVFGVGVSKKVSQNA
jgi:DNA-directed RNA polymerase specialized sigma24 family protein